MDMHSAEILCFVVLFAGIFIYFGIALSEQNPRSPSTYPRPNCVEPRRRQRLEILDRAIQNDDVVINVRGNSDGAGYTLHRVVWINGDTARVRPLHARAHQRRDHKTHNLRPVRLL